MATAQEVERAIRTLARKLAEASPDPSQIPDRSIICVLPDLDTAFFARLAKAKLDGLRRARQGETSDVRITARSDDLVALIEGRMNVTMAFLMGKVRIDAPVSDLMLLRRVF